MVLESFWSAGFRKTIESTTALSEDSATAKVLNTRGKSRGISVNGTTASAWFPTVSISSSRNVILREEAVSLGRFGALTILTIQSGTFPKELLPRE